MALLYHKIYNKDVTETVPNGSPLEVRMSWSHVNPQTRETVAVLLLTGPSPQPTSIARGYPQQQPVAPSAYALKVLLFVPATDSSRGEEEICNALFELNEAPVPSVLSGTSGLIFVSTRHFLFLTRSGSAEGALDSFVVLKEKGDGGVERWAWQRKPFVVRPINDIPPLCQALGSGERHIILLARVQVLDEGENLMEDTCDVLMVACTANNDAVLGKNGNKKKNNDNYCFDSPREVFSLAALQRTHTFLVALLRYSALPRSGASGSWELRHLFVERAVPFLRYMHEAAAGAATSGAWNTSTDATAANATTTATSTEPLMLEPQHCTWCFVPHTGLRNACNPDHDDHTINHSSNGRVCGAIFALVPDPLRSISVVCGGFDSVSASYQLGFVSSSMSVVAEEVEIPEESLWNLMADTHTVQMILSGRPLEALSSGAAGNSSSAPNAVMASAARRHRAGWMKQAGVTALLRFCVDFMNDGIVCGSASGGIGGKGGGYCSGKSPELSSCKKRSGKQQQLEEKGQQQRQGLYIVACAPWEHGRHGRVPLPRTLCWLDTMPLPLGHDVTSSLCANETSYAVVGDEEDPAVWFGALPTSLASAVPVQDRSRASDVRCFVSINALLKQTRLTFVVQTGRALSTKSATGHSRSHTNRGLELTDILQLFPSGSMMNTSTDAADQALAEWMARTASMNDHLPPGSAPDGVSSSASRRSEITPEFVIHTAWRRIAMERYPSLAMTLLDTLCLSHENEEEIQHLAESLCHFLMNFLTELDWSAGEDGSDLLRGVVLLMLGAVNKKLDDLHPMAIVATTTVNQTSASLWSETSATKVPRITPGELHSVQFLLKQCSRWPSLVEVLFAFVNRRRDIVESDLIVLDDLLRLWADECHGEVLQQFREAQDPDLFLNAVSALARGNISVAGLAAAACWRTDASNIHNNNNHMNNTCDPFVTLLQLFIDVAVAASQSSVLSVMDAKRIISDVVRVRFPTHSVVPCSVLARMSGFGFACLADWPLTAMGGALPQALLIHHLAVQASKEENEDVTVKEALANAAGVFHWLCGEKEEQAVFVMRTLCAARVSLMDLALSRSRRCSAACSRALHHILMSPHASLLKDAFVITKPSHESEVTCAQMALTLWAVVIEGDKAAAFNPKLLHMLLEALEGKGPAGASVLLDYLQPVFMTAVPRMLAAAVEDTDSVSSVLALMRSDSIAPEETIWVAAPPLECDSVARVCLHVFQEVKQLLALYEKESLEVQCLVHLFHAFRATWSKMLEPRLKTSAFRSHRDGVVDDTLSASNETEEPMILVFNPPEMFFIALQIVSNEPARFIVAAEVMRRSLRLFLQQRMEGFILQEDKPMTSSEVNLHCRNFINTTVEKFEMIISAFEITAPLYEHTLILLFLDESVAFLNTNSDTSEGHFSEQVRKELLECIGRAATTEWVKLHRQEKNLLRRVLSVHFMLLLKDESIKECENSTLFQSQTYAESETHHCAMRETARLSESLHGHQSIDPAILLSVRKAFLTDSLPGAALNATACETPDTCAVDALLLVTKEEAYIRRREQEKCSQAYDTFIGSHIFQEALAVLYLALRDEQRRRVFVEYALQQKDIIFNFEYMVGAQISEMCRNEARKLRQQATEEFHRRVRFLFTQEREARNGVVAVCHVEREILIAHAFAQGNIFEMEAHASRILTEEEELERDAIYELCAREELKVSQRLAERLEEEAWKAEEAQWAEMQEEPPADTAQSSERSKGSAFLKWQERQLATVKAWPSISQTVNETAPSESLSFDKRLPSPAPPPIQRITDSHGTNPLPPPRPPSSLAEALSPLFVTGVSSPSANETEKAAGLGILPSTLSESSESIMSTLSWWQKKIISTVAPPPPSQTKDRNRSNTSQSHHSLENVERDDKIDSAPSPLRPFVHEENTSAIHYHHHHHRHHDADHTTVEGKDHSWDKKSPVAHQTHLVGDVGTKEKLRDANEQRVESTFEKFFSYQQTSTTVLWNVQNQEPTDPEKQLTAPFATPSPPSSGRLDLFHREHLTSNTTPSSPFIDEVSENNQRSSLMGKRRAQRRRGLGDVVSLDVPITEDHSHFLTAITSKQSSIVSEKQVAKPSPVVDEWKNDDDFGDTLTVHPSTEVKSVIQRSLGTAPDASTVASHIHGKATPHSLPVACAAPSRAPLESAWDEEDIAVQGLPVDTDLKKASSTAVHHHLCIGKESRHRSSPKEKRRTTRRSGLGDIVSLDSIVKESIEEIPQSHQERGSLMSAVSSGAVPVNNNQGDSTATPVVEERFTAPILSSSLPASVDSSSRMERKENGLEDVVCGMWSNMLLEKHVLPFVESENEARFILFGEEQLLRGLMLRRFILEL